MDHIQVAFLLLFVDMSMLKQFVDTPTAKAASPSLQDGWDSEVPVRTQAISVLSEPSDEGVPSP
ncbi:hypothetical protein, partial [Exiguobacterium sp. s21]|uniref:hypothetical protein n=1 Tax=Exiguobacterium sp. s21 TaxID=2751244 RepID=UPI001BEC56E4